MPLAFLNGRYVAPGELAIAVDDGGFMQGVTVAEQLRTFRGRLFRLEDHLARLRWSLEIVNITLPMSLDELATIANRVAAENYAALDSLDNLGPGDDLGLTIFVTPGTYSAVAHGPPRPVVCVHPRPLPLARSAQLYQHGDALVVTSIRQVSRHCWPPELKCRSRVHYYLADQEAERRQPGARALLLDEDGYVCEATTANLVAHFPGEGIVSPRHDKILPGISVATLAELCRGLSLPFGQRDLTPNELHGASEILMCSTSPCVWPVTQLDGRPIGGGRPGPVFQQLLAAWSQLVGVDIAAQAARHAPPRP